LGVSSKPARPRYRAPSPGRHGPAVPVEGVEPSRLAAPPIRGGEVRRVFRVEVPPSRPLCHAARHGNMPGAVPPSGVTRGKGPSVAVKRGRGGPDFARWPGRGEGCG